MLVGYSPRGRKELAVIERLTLSPFHTHNTDYRKLQGAELRGEVSRKSTA